MQHAVQALVVLSIVGAVPNYFHKLGVKLDGAVNSTRPYVSSL